MKRFKELLKIAQRSPPGAVLLPASSSPSFLIIATTGGEDGALLLLPGLSLSVFIPVAHNTGVHLPPTDKVPFTAASPASSSSSGK